MLIDFVATLEAINPSRELRGAMIGRYSAHGPSKKRKVASVATINDC